MTALLMVRHDQDWSGALVMLALLVVIMLIDRVADR